MVAGSLTRLNISMRPWHGKRWLVLAPHADDETLGAGALIAQSADERSLAGVVYLTDGSGSHDVPNGKAGKLISTRKREARAALRCLTGHAGVDPIFLDWRDASPSHPGDPQFERSCRFLATLCTRLRVDVLATTASHEPHCDHAAAADLARAVQRAVKRAIAVAEYVVWGHRPSARTHSAVATGYIHPGLRRRALSAHRSQLTASHGAGFRLPKAQRSMSPRDILYVRRR